jgi:hypothetical protein
MFGKKADFKANADKDIDTLMGYMDRIISGDFTYIDVSAFNNKQYGEKLNQVIHAFKNANNTYVMRLNESMMEIGDNSNVKNMLDQVQVQAESIKQMENSSHILEESIGNITNEMAAIKDNTQTIYNVSQNGTVNMTASIKAVNESSDMIANINCQVQDFQEKIEKISEIVTIVKNIASQSNLLALNASIEAARAGIAGRGFAIVADQVRQLSINTSSSAEDIVSYVSQLNEDIKKLVTATQQTTEKLSKGNDMVKNSLNDMEDLNSRISVINSSINSIFTDIDMQSEITKEFANQVADINTSYAGLSETCNTTGRQEYRMGRSIDKCRSDMARHYSDLSEIDWIKIFEVDHFILMWRVYNHIMGFESLKLSQLNNPNACKLGKWMAKQTDTRLTRSIEFKEVEKNHRAVHRYATAAWEASASNNTRLAMENFQKTHDAYYDYQKSIRKLITFIQTLGNFENTEIKAG